MGGAAIEPTGHSWILLGIGVEVAEDVVGGNLSQKESGSIHELDAGPYRWHMCRKLHTPGKAHLPRFHERQMRLGALGVALVGSWHLGQKGMLLAISLEPGGGTAFLVAGATEFSAQSSVEWSTSLQMAWSYRGVCL